MLAYVYVNHVLAVTGIVNLQSSVSPSTRRVMERVSYQEAHSKGVLMNHLNTTMIYTTVS